MPVTAREQVRRQVLDIDDYVLNLYSPPPVPTKARDPDEGDEDGGEVRRAPRVKRVKRKPVYTFDDIRLIAVKAARYDKPEVLEAIRRFNVDKISMVDPMHYPTLAADLQKIIEDGQ